MHEYLTEKDSLKVSVKEPLLDARATSKGQVVIPAPLRKKYGIKAGTRFNVTDRNGEISFQPVTADLIHRLRGSLKGSGILQALIEERRKDREREDAKFSRRSR